MRRAPASSGGRRGVAFGCFPGPLAGKLCVVGTVFWSGCSWWWVELGEKVNLKIGEVVLFIFKCSCLKNYSEFGVDIV